MKKFLLPLIFALATTRSLAVVPSPYTQAEECSITISLPGGGGGLAMTVYDESSSPPSPNTGVNSGESIIAIAVLLPGKEYKATVSGTLIGVWNGTNYTFNGSYTTSFTSPAGYTFYINNVPTESYVKTISATSGSMSMPISDSYTIKLVPKIDFTPTTAGTFSGISVGKAIDWNIALGGLKNGSSAGRIYFSQQDLTNGPSTRDRLFYAAQPNNSQITAVYDPSTTRLYQISAPQAFVNLVDDGSGGYNANFYVNDPSHITWNGSSYTISGINPWKNIHVQAPSSTTLQITETEGSYNRVSLLTLASGTVSTTTNYQWTLQEGGGQPTPTTWLRTTTHNFVYTASPTAYREDTVVVRTGDVGGTIVAKTRYHYVVYPWGEEVTQISADPDTSNLLTTYTYFSGGVGAGNYDKLQSVTDPTGHWTSYAYYDDWNRRGQLQTISQPYVNTPGTWSTASLAIGNSSGLDYSADFSGRYRVPSTRTDWVNTPSNLKTGQQSSVLTLNNSRYSQNYSTFTTTDWASNPFGSSPLSQQTYSETIDPTGLNADYFGLPLCVKRPDQTEDAYAYYLGTYSGTTFTASSSGTYLRSNVFHGTTNSSGADSFTSYASQTVSTVYLVPNKSTMDVSIQSPSGLVLRTEKWVYIGSQSFTLLSWANFTYDFAGRLTQQAASNNTTVTSTITNGLVMATFDTTGTETDYTYDQLWRQRTSVKKGAASIAAVLTSGYNYLVQQDITTTNTYDGANHVTQQVASSVSISLTSSATYDLAGRVKTEVAPGTTVSGSGPANFTTSYAYTSNGLVPPLRCPIPLPRSRRSISMDRWPRSPAQALSRSSTII